MNGYLLDTNVALLSLVSPERISAAARAAIEEGPNVLSAISYWEVVLKSMKGKLDAGERGFGGRMRCGSWRRHLYLCGRGMWTGWWSWRRFMRTRSTVFWWRRLWRRGWIW